MRALLALTVIPAVLPAGVIQGVVIDQISGLPLARTRVELRTVPKPGMTGMKTLQLRSSQRGHFLFPAVPDGSYILTAIRDSYFNASYGQRRPAGQGMPVAITRDSDVFAQLPMFRMGAITGRVLDENGIGMSNAPVIAYRARLPLRPSGRAVSDDRGVYRIHGLDPGKYWVRSGAFTHDDGSTWLPTFGPESREIRLARVHEVRLGTDATDADVRPEMGPLFRLEGPVECMPLGTAVEVTLSTETGRKTVQSGCGGNYRFDGLAPAMFQLVAVKKDDSGDTGFNEFYADHQIPGGIKLLAQTEVRFETRRSGGAAATDIPVTVTGRREEFSEAEAPRTIATPRTFLAAGRWEMQASVGEGQFVESIVGARISQRRGGYTIEPPVEWHEVLIAPQGVATVRITVSDQAGQIAGTVLGDGKPVAGVPVFLWPVAEGARRSLRGGAQTLTDTEGRYIFRGLPPADYRMVATFDLTEIDEQVLDEAKAQTLAVAPSQKLTKDVDLWNAP